MQDETKYIDEDIYEIDLREYLMIIWHKKWIIIALVILAVLTSFFITQRMERIYQTSTLVMVQTENSAEDIFSEQLSFTARNDKLLNTYSRIFRSRRILDKVIQDVGLKNEEGDFIQAGSLRENISIQSNSDSDLITIQVNYNDPKLAQQIADSLIVNMQAEIKNLNQTSLRSASNFIENQLEDTKNRLLELEDDLLAYRENNEIIMPQTQGENLLNRYTELEQKRAESNILAEEARLALEAINEKLRGIDEKIISSQSISRNPQISQIQTQLTGLYTELEGLKTKYTEKHPSVIEVQARIDNLEEELNNKTAEIVNGKTETNNPLYQNLNAQIIEKEIQQITASAAADSYELHLKEIESQLDEFPEKELNYLRLQREKMVTEEIYLLLRNRKEEINIQQAMQTSDIFVVDEAYLPENPIRPNLRLNLAIASILALMLAVFIIFLLEFLDNTVKTEDDIENISDLPVLGIIPDLNQIEHHKNYGKENLNG